MDCAKQSIRLVLVYTHSPEINFCFCYPSLPIAQSLKQILNLPCFFPIGNYEKGDFDTPLDPMKNETIHAGLEGLYLLSSPVRDMKNYGKTLAGGTPASL